MNEEGNCTEDNYDQSNKAQTLIVKFQILHGRKFGKNNMCLLYHTNTNKHTHINTHSRTNIQAHKYKHISKTICILSAFAAS